MSQKVVRGVRIVDDKGRLTDEGYALLADIIRRLEALETP